jgi:phage-related protein
MADERNYIGIAMGLDVTDLKAGLSEANKQIQLANSEFKAASSGMEDWRKSTDGLSAKIKQLDTVLGAQKAKLSGLQAEYEKVAKEQGEGSEAARKLRVQINNQQAVVNKTQQEFDNYSETLKQAKDGTIDLGNATLQANGKIKDFGDGAQSASDNVKGGFGKGAAAGIVGGIAAIGAAAVAAVGGFLSLAESTREARENFNKLETGFTTAGHTAEDAQATYKELYGILGDEGQATEAAAHLAQLAKSQEDLSKWTDISAGVYATFGDSLPIENLTEAANETAKTGKITGGLADALNWAGESEEEFQAKLDAASSEQERQALITNTLNGLYSDQSKTFKELNGDIIAAREADAALTQAMAELGAVAEPIMTTLKELATDLLKEMQPFVELIGKGLKGALEGTEGSTDLLAEGLSGILSLVAEKAVQILPTLLETLASVFSTLLPQLISTLAGIIPILISTLAEQLPVILQALISGFSQILTSIGAMLPELIPVIIDAVLMIVETLLDNIDQLIDAGIALLLGLADGLIEALPRLIDKIPVIIDKLMGAFSRNAPKLIQAGIELIVKLAGGLIKAIPQLISKIPEIISSLVSGFADYYSNLGEVGLGIVEGIWEGITGGADWLKKKISGFAGDVAGWFEKTFKIGSPSKLIEDKVGVFVGQGIVPTRPSALAKVKKTLGGFTDYVSENLGGIKGNLALEGAGGGGASRIGGNSTVINAGMTVNFNGNLSRKKLKRIGNDNYTAIRTRLKKEGAI